MTQDTSQGFSLQSDLSSVISAAGIHDNLVGPVMEGSNHFMASLLPELPVNNAMAQLNENALAAITEGSNHFMASLLPELPVNNVMA